MATIRSQIEQASGIPLGGLGTGSVEMRTQTISTKKKSASPSKAQQRWMELGYGLFIHFGPNTFTAAGWGDGKFPAAAFHPAALDTGHRHNTLSTLNRLPSSHS